MSRTRKPSFTRSKRWKIFLNVVLLICVSSFNILLPLNVVHSTRLYRGSSSIAKWRLYPQIFNTPLFVSNLTAVPIYQCKPRCLSVKCNISSLESNVLGSSDTSANSTETKSAQADENGNGSYNSDDIIVLEGLNAVRKRPGMYIGNTGDSGIHQLLYEVLDNSVDEYLAGACNRINVTLKSDGFVEISDNGRGIPCDISTKTNKSGLETVLTVLHSGGKFMDCSFNEDGIKSSERVKSNGSKTESNLQSKRKTLAAPYEYSSGLHGVGLSVVNALSERLSVEVYKGDKRYNMGLSKGKIISPLTSTDCVKKFGTTVKFIPDYTDVFKTHHKHINGSECTGCSSAFNLDSVKHRTRELSYLNPGLFIKLRDERVVNENNQVFEEVYHNTGGIRALLQEAVKDKTPLYKPINIITIKGKGNALELEVSFTWSVESFPANIKGYANNVSTTGGTHIDGFKAAITRAVNSCLKAHGYFKGGVVPLSGDFIREGLTAIISIKLSGAEFDGQTKTKLGNPLAKTVVERIVTSQLTDILDSHPHLLLLIHNKSQSAKKAFDAAKMAKDMVRQKAASIITSGSLAKLYDCTSNDTDLNEIFIVEGESAAGNAKQARKRQFQAVLPLKGKILNIERISDNIKVLENDEIKLLMSSLGLSIDPTTWRHDPEIPEGAETLDSIIPDKTLGLRYGKIILLTDADVDGAHLRALLLGLLFRLCPQLYEDGRVFIACPPLYRITDLRKNSTESKFTYVWSEKKMRKLVKRANTSADSSKRYTVQRFKGLGEMMPQQLWETTMDPERRLLSNISVSDAKKASDLLGLLFGRDIQSRREYIFSNTDSFQISDLDI